MGFYIISAATTLIYVAVSWLLIGRLHLSSDIEMVVRVLIVGLGVSLFGFVYHLRERRQRARAQNASGAGQQVTGDGLTDREVESFLREAESRLAGSPLGKEARLGSLPVFLVLGESESAKTCTIIQSGAEPDLLAGQVYQDNNIRPTRPVNLWLAKDSVLVEAGGKLLAEPDRWRHLIRGLQSSHRRFSLFGGKPQAPRAAILCVEADLFLNPSEDARAANNRAIQERLGEIAQILGVSLPVYALITKLDRIACFSEFCANLAKDEINQVLGVTLPLSTSVGKGVYGEQQARRLTAAFDNLAASLCDKRLPFLARDDDQARRPAVYEFPREFRKLRNPLVSFLVDVCRPSQLRAYPVLRGFYFSGVRPVVVQESSAVPKRISLGQQAAQATGLFRVDEPASASESQVRLRRIPQWLFLGHLFNDVILQDRSALGVSGYSVHAENARRVAFTVAGAAFLLWAAASTVSYIGNRELENQVSDAARGIAQFETGGGAQDLPGRASLQRLETLRQSVELLSRYAREGPPWNLRFGLYTGGQLYQTTRRLYFARFKQLMFGATQFAIVDRLQTLPFKPGPNDDYKPGYDALKAYLMTTSHHEKSSRAFLPPVLYGYWAGTRQIDPERAALARRQFDFYSDELLIANPYGSDHDADTVKHAREYLKGFNGIDRVYQSILAQASQKHRSVNFNSDVPGSAAFVTSNKDIAGAFTIDGWKTVDEAIHNVRKMFESEAWVLGDDAYAALDPDKIVPELLSRYHRDFIGNWRAYLASSHVVGFQSMGDAAQKLKQLSSNQSYLLRLFCLASVHTAVKDEETAAPFQPVQYVEEPNCSDRWVQDHNSQYVSALGSLQQAVERVVQNGPNIRDDLVEQTRSEAGMAYRVTGQIAQNFRIDKDGNVHQMVQQILEEPIRYAENLLGRLGPFQLNSQGRQFCGAFTELANKYPFNTSSSADVKIEEFDAIFRPGDGRIDQFYESSLKNYLNRQGAVFTRKPDTKVQITDAFLGFLNRAAAVSDALYRGGSKEPRIVYTMKAMPAPNVNSVVLTLDGQVLNSNSAGGASKDFAWPGPTHGAKFAVSFGGPMMELPEFQGLWATFRLFGDADQFQASGGSTYTLQWVPRQGQSGQPWKVEGKVVTLPFQLDLKGAPPIFQKGYFSGLRCIPDVAR